MKSCLGMLFTLIILAAVIGGGAALWYLSTTTQVTRKAPASTAIAPESPIR